MPVGPHSAVALQLKQVAGQAKAWQRVVPRSFPLPKNEEEKARMQWGPSHQPPLFDWASLLPHATMEQCFDAAESALGRLHGLDDKQLFGRAKGCQVQVAPLA
eukprot:5403240-Pyramimonas_sp.AAC.1